MRDMRAANWKAVGRDSAKDIVAGAIASVVLIANIVSFGALMFPGDLSGGISTAIWAMLIGGCVGGVWIALMTSLPPLATGIDSPTGVVLVVLSAAAGASTLANGGSAQSAVDDVMLLFTLATLMTGALLLVLGVLRWGSYLRFVPFFVVGGFLAATGWLLIAGGVRMTTGRALALDSLLTPWTASEMARLASAVATLAVLLSVRRWLKSPFAMPVALVVMALAGALVLRSQGLTAAEHGWYFPSLGSLSPWLPLEAVQPNLQPVSILKFLPELLAVSIVALISLVTKVSSLELIRQAAGDLNRELRAHGIASIAAAPLGGITASLQTGTSRLLEQTGGATRMSGVVCALIMGAVALGNLDLLRLIAIPIIAGLVFYLGYTFIIDALWRPYAQRAWLDLLLVVAIMAVCIRFGYIAGVLAGIVCACLLFATSYARTGVIRRHLTRAQFASYVDRSPSASRHLRESGSTIQLYWLSGYIFFGSSESVFERVRDDVLALSPRKVAYVILDFGMVSGADSSAGASLAKLQNFCVQHGIMLIYCSLSRANVEALKRGGFLAGKNPPKGFADINLALAWCEDQLLARAAADSNPDPHNFEQWLQQQLGGDVNAADLISYLERKETEASQVLYREGEPADTVDLVAAGNLVIEIAKEGGESLRVRRTTTHTVLGEMGFFRRSTRAATVSSDGPATLYTLTRASFERMREERPDLAGAFYDFIIRILADRIDFANRGVAALSRQRQ
jgi:SulP family sulfate permease